MTGCGTARRLMDARLDGEIGPADAIELEAHLRGCAACRSIVSGLEEVAAGLLRLPLEGMPDADLESVLARTVGAVSGETARGSGELRSGFQRPAGDVVGQPDSAGGRWRSTAARSHGRDVVFAHGRWASSGRLALAAAAVLAAVAIVPWALRSSATPEPTASQIEVAAREARMVLALASRAVRSAESTARDRVIAREVSPALQRVPVRWDRVASPRRNGA